MVAKLKPKLFRGFLMFSASEIQVVQAKLGWIKVE